LESNTNFGDIMKKLVRDPETTKAGSYSDLVRKMLEDILSDPIETRDRRLQLQEYNFDEKYSIEDARGLLSLESGYDQAEILVYSEDDKDLSKHDPQSKARFARPFKPAIYISDK
jgi:leucyl-tRNA synthetase